MSVHPNLQVMRDALQAFGSGDMASLSRLFAEDVVWRVPGRNAMAKVYVGQADVFGFFGRLMELTNGTFRIESLDMFANETGGVYVDRLLAERDGRRLDVRLLLHVTIREGRIVEGVDYIHPEHAWDAFWEGLDA